MVESRQQRGVIVLPRDRWNFLDMDILGWVIHTRADPEMLIRLTEVRMIVEPGACMLAATSATDSGFERIEDAWRRMNIYANDEKLFILADRDFHIAILMASGNEYLAAFGSVISAALTCSLEHTNANENNQSSLPWHRHIFEAIKKKKGDLAARASRQQLKVALSLLQEGGFRQS